MNLYCKYYGIICQYVNCEDGSCNTSNGKCAWDYLRDDYQTYNYDEEEDR